MDKVIYLVSLTLIFAACNNTPAVETVSEQVFVLDSAGSKYVLDTAASVLNWDGASLSHGHVGTINLSDGFLMVEEGKLTAGSFTINIKSIKCTDIDDPEKNALLVGHLNDTDFFDSKKYPMGKFEITNVNTLSNDTAGNTHIVSGNLTLKGQSKNITFPIKMNIDEKVITAKGSVMVNRLDWGIKYASATAFPNLKAKLKDNAIKDEFKVIISLSAKKG